MIPDQLNAQFFADKLNREVPESLVVLAKHDVMGVDDRDMAEILGMDESDIQAEKKTELYIAIRAVLSMVYAEIRAHQGMSYDHLEAIALQRLTEKTQYMNDPELLLRVAAMANKAERRVGRDSNVLRPQEGNGTTVISLTKKLTQTIINGEPIRRVGSADISIMDGTMSQCTTEDINGVLGNEQDSSPIGKVSKDLSTDDALQRELRKFLGE